MPRSPSTIAPGSSWTSFATQIRASSGSPCRRRAPSRARGRDDERRAPCRTTATGRSGTTATRSVCGYARSKRRAATVGNAATSLRRVEIEPKRLSPRASASARSTWRSTPGRRRATSIVRTANSGVSRATTRPGARRRGRANPTSSERPEGTKRASRGDRRRPHAGTGRRRSPRARASRSCARLVPFRPRARFLPRGRRSPRLRRSAVRRRRVPEQHDLVLELDPEPLARPPAGLGHQREAVRAGRAAGVLDEVRVPRRDRPRRRSRCPLSPQSSSIRPAPSSPGGFLKTEPNVRLFVGWVALRRATSSATSALISSTGRGDSRYSTRRRPGPAELGVPVREPELGGRQPAAPSASTTSARSRIAPSREPYAPAFIRTPPPAVPGIAQANSRPPRPAARARWRQTAFVAPPPARSSSPSTRPPRARPRAGGRARRRRRPPRAGSSRARPSPRQVALGRPRERLLELGERLRAARTQRQARRCRSSSAATSGTVRSPWRHRLGEPREAATIARAARHGSPTPSVTTTSPGRQRAPGGRRRRATAPRRAASGRAPRRGRAARDALARRVAAPTKSVTTATSASPSASPSSRWRWRVRSTTCGT